MLDFKYLRVLLVSGIVISTILAVNFYQQFSEDTQTEVAHKFLDAFLNGNSERAEKYLSRDLRQYVEGNCSQGLVTNCLNKLDRAAWGKLSRITFEYAKPTMGVVGFTVSFQQRLGLFVVVTLAEENGQWVVSGWRGFDSVSDRSKVLVGTLTPNSFPN